MIRCNAFLNFFIVATIGCAGSYSPQVSTVPSPDWVARAEMIGSMSVEQVADKYFASDTQYQVFDNIFQLDEVVGSQANIVYMKDESILLDGLQYDVDASRKNPSEKITHSEEAFLFPAGFDFKLQMVANVSSDTNEPPPFALCWTSMGQDTCVAVGISTANFYLYTLTDDHRDFVVNAEMPVQFAIPEGEEENHYAIIQSASKLSFQVNGVKIGTTHAYHGNPPEKIFLLVGSGASLELKTIELSALPPEEAVRRVAEHFETTGQTDALFRIGELYLERGEIETAGSFFLKSRRIEEGVSLIRDSDARRMGEYRRTPTELERVFENRNRASSVLGMMAPLEGFLHQMIAIWPGEWTAEYQNAIAQLARYYLDAFQRGVAANPGDSAAHAGLAVAETILLRTNLSSATVVEFRTVLSHFDTAIQLHPDPLFRFLRGMFSLSWYDESRIDRSSRTAFVTLRDAYFMTSHAFADFHAATDSSDSRLQRAGRCATEIADDLFNVQVPAGAISDSLYFSPPGLTKYLSCLGGVSLHTNSNANDPSLQTQRQLDIEKETMTMLEEFLQQIVASWSGEWSEDYYRTISQLARQRLSDFQRMVAVHSKNGAAHAGIAVCKTILFRSRVGSATQLEMRTLLGHFDTAVHLSPHPLVKMLRGAFSMSWIDENRIDRNTGEAFIKGGAMYFLANSALVDFQSATDSTDLRLQQAGHCTDTLAKDYLDCIIPAAAVGYSIHFSPILFSMYLNCFQGEAQQ